MAICGGRVFEAPTYQTVTIFNKCTKVYNTDIPRLTYIACCMPVLSCFRVGKTYSFAILGCVLACVNCKCAICGRILAWHTTIGNMASGGLRATSLSTVTNVYAG